MATPRILMINHATGIGGPLLQAVVLSYLPPMVASGYPVHLLTFENLSQSGEQRERIFRVEHQLEGAGVGVHVVNHWRLPSPLPSLVDSIRGALYGGILIRRYDLNLVEGRSVIAGQMGSWLKKLRGVPFVYNAGPLVAEAGAQAGFYPWGGTKFRTIYALERRLMRTADAVRVESSRHRERLLESEPEACKAALREKFYIIPSNTDTTRFNFDPSARDSVRRSLGLTNGETVFVYSGNMLYGRPDREMAQFVALYDRVHGPAHFLVLTYSDHLSVEQILQAELPQSKYSILHVQPEQVAAYLSAADIGLVFLVPRAHAHSMPMKFAEYLACQLPVVINEGIGDTEQIIRTAKVGILLGDLTRDSLQKGVKSLHDLMHDRDELRRRCRQVAEDRLSVDVGLRDLVTMYTSVLE